MPRPSVGHAPAPTGERPPADMPPERISVPPESVVPPVWELALLSLTAPGPTISTDVSPVKSDRTLLVVPADGARVTVAAAEPATIANPAEKAGAQACFLVIIFASFIKL